MVIFQFAMLNYLGDMLLLCCSESTSCPKSLHISLAAHHRRPLGRPGFTGRWPCIHLNLHNFSCFTLPLIRLVCDSYCTLLTENHSSDVAGFRHYKNYPNVSSYLIRSLLYHHFLWLNQFNPHNIYVVKPVLRKKRLPARSALETPCSY
jgi:hypothetical protein